MFCENCGAEVKAGARFCECCGTPLSVAEPESPVQAPPAQEPPKPAPDTVIPPRMDPPAPSASVGQQSGSHQTYGTYAEPQLQAVRPTESMSFVEAIKDFFNRYADFKGRTIKSGFWWVVLFNCVVNVALNRLGTIVPFLDIVGYLYSVVMIIPLLAVDVRRLHDIGKSGKWLFMALVPIAGWIWLIVQYVKPSAGDNQWGLAPESRKDFPPQI